MISGLMHARDRQSDPGRLSAETAAVLARIGLGHATRDYPNKLDHVLTCDADLQPPRTLHPVFYGSFDWHSCVHTYWMLARLLRRHPALAVATEIRALFGTHLVPGRVAGECDYMQRPAARGFERPYGWAWLLKLAAELRAFPTEPWAAALAPLATLVADRVHAFLPVATYPVRSGAHGNTAFALALAADYAVYADAALLRLLKDTAARWYVADAACQAWEPSGDDFLSPALVEAECMRRLLPRDAFHVWFDGFLPDLDKGRPATLFTPVRVSDRSDGKIAHLDGLNLSRAWCLQSLAAALPDGDPRQAGMTAAAADHLAASLPFVAGHYMGEHWLASFAVLALDD